MLKLILGRRPPAQERKAGNAATARRATARRRWLLHRLFLVCSHNMQMRFWDTGVQQCRRAARRCRAQLLMHVHCKGFCQGNVTSTRGGPARGTNLCRRATTIARTRPQMQARLERLLRTRGPVCLCASQTTRRPWWAEVLPETAVSYSGRIQRCGRPIWNASNKQFWLAFHRTRRRQTMEIGDFGWSTAHDGTPHRSETTFRPCPVQTQSVFATRST